MASGHVYRPELLEGSAHRGVAGRRLLPAGDLPVSNGDGFVAAAFRDFRVPIARSGRRAAVCLCFSNRQLRRVESLLTCWKQTPGIVSNRQLLRVWLS
jgi:hypothetical protein